MHSEIKSRRLALGWSQQRLATEVSALEGLAKPLTWQTVQQWELEDDQGGTAPKRKRLNFVAQALGTTVECLMAARAPSDTANTKSGAGLTGPGLAEALEVVARALGDLPAGRWSMVRARLDDLVGHPEMRDDVVADVLPLLEPTAEPGKQRAAA